MSGLDSPIPLTWALGWAVVLLLAVVGSYARLWQRLSPSYLVVLAVLRALALVVVLVLLLQPYRVVRTPDRSRFEVALLADCSASMGTRDCRGDRSRLEALRDEVGSAATPGLFRELRDQYRVRPYLFSSDSHAWPGHQISALPGLTNLGGVLQQRLEESSGVPLGAVVLLSDGHANTGPVPTEVAKAYRRRGIPISCVGFGERHGPGDVAVSFVADRVTAKKGEELTLAVRLQSTLGQAVTAVVELSDESGVLARREVAVPPGSAETVEEFQVTPAKAGPRTYAARIRPVPGDSRRETDVDYLAARVLDPDVFKVLALTAHLDWEYKFAKIAAEASNQLAVAAVVRTGPQAFYTTGLPAKSAAAGFPEDEGVLNDYDVIVLDTRALALLPARAIESLVGFVANRGGGLLCHGPVDQLPEAIGRLLPLTAAVAKTSRTRTPLEIVTGTTFAADPAGAFTAAPGPFLQQNEPAWITDQLKKGARPCLALRGSAEPVAMAAQSYGSGRTVYLGTESTWRWRLESQTGTDLHERFWQSLLVWLGSTAKQRLVARCAGLKVGLGDEVKIGLDLLGPDYLPATDAQVTGTIATPSGQTHALLLNAMADPPGRYEELFVPEAPGEYKVSFRAELSGELIEQEAHFLARHTGTETADTEYCENLLRDTARLTQGRFRHYSEARPGDYPLSASVPSRQERLYLSDSWTLIVLLFLILGLDWYCRRRVGLQ